MKTILFIIAAYSMLSLQAHAQVGQAWLNLYNGSDSVTDSGKDAALDAAGNLYVTGISRGDIVLIKYNPAGVQQWVRTHTGTGSSGDIGEEIRIDASGNIYIGGIIKNAGSQNDIALLKYNSAGTQQWVKTVTGSFPTGNDKFGGMTLDAAGNIYITGMVSDTLSDLNAITVKFTPAGSEVWRAKYESSPGNSYQDEGISLTLDASGNVYMCGLTFFTISGSGDMVTVKYNAAGLQQWARMAGSTFIDQASDIAVSDSGFIYVTGKIYYGTTLRDDIVTIKYDPAGAELWRLNYNDIPGSYERGEFIILDDSSNVYVGGTGADYLLIKYGAGGEQKWVQRYNGPHNYADYLAGMVMDGEGNIYLTGEAQDTVETDGASYPHAATVKINNAGGVEWSRVAPLYTFGNDVEVDDQGDTYVTGWGKGPTSEDLMVIKYSPSVGIQQIFSEIPSGFSLSQNYPNPFNPVTDVGFRIADFGFVSLRIYDITGKEVAVLVNENLKAGTYKYSFDATGLNSGVYFYRLTAGEFSETKKMVLIK
jgi:hypothetical protein